MVIHNCLVERVVMTENELYNEADKFLGPYLVEHGFRISQPGEYIRTTVSGSDRILVSRGPGNKAKTHFAVWMSYYPTYLLQIDEIAPLGEEEERGFPCGPYLSPVGVLRRQKFWSYKNASVLTASLNHVLQCLRQVGLVWLESLRAPQKFADEVDPLAVLPAGLANEIAGNTEKARVFYNEVLRRLHLIIQNTKDETEFLRTFGKKFVFVTMKLGVENEKCEQVQRKLNYYPSIKPL